jgi:hypothetical protein
MLTQERPEGLLHNNQERHITSGSNEWQFQWTIYLVSEGKDEEHNSMQVWRNVEVKFHAFHASTQDGDPRLDLIGILYVAEKEGSHYKRQAGIAQSV